MKHKLRPPINKNKIQLPGEHHYSPPNSSYLNKCPNQDLALKINTTDLTCVHSVFLELSESLISSSSLFSCFSTFSF